jgi:hypothetical protein
MSEVRPINEGGDRMGIFSAVRHKRLWPLWTASILSGVAYTTALTACGWVALKFAWCGGTAATGACPPEPP